MCGDNAVSKGHSMFARYAFPPNELGYCGPPGVPEAAGLVLHAREFDGAWPYLRAIAEARATDNPLDAEVVASYWLGGPLLDKVDPAMLLARLRIAFTGQFTGLLDGLAASPGVLAHHSFHVLVVYPWVRFLGHDPATPLRVLQNCRIRWGTVGSVVGEHALITCQPLTFNAGTLALDVPVNEWVRWSKDGSSLAPAPVPGDTVSAHWNWICGTLNRAETEALTTATQTTLDLVNSARHR